MVSLAHDNSTAPRFVTEFNQSLAAAEPDAVSPDPGGGDVAVLRDREGQDTGAQRHQLHFVSQFNQSLAAAKLEALNLLRSFIAGEMPDRGNAADRERRLAASQVLRTRFLQPDGSEAPPKPRKESRLRASDAGQSDRQSDGHDAERPSSESPKPRRESRLRASDAEQPNRHSDGQDAERSSEARDDGLSASAPTDARSPVPDPSTTASSAPLRENDPDFAARLAVFEARRARVIAALKHLPPAERSRAVNDAMASMRQHPRAPP